MDFFSYEGRQRLGSENILVTALRFYPEPGKML